MHSPDTLTSYVSNFRRFVSPHLSPGTALTIKIWPAKGEGAVLEIQPKIKGFSSDSIFEPKETILKILESVNQKFIQVNSSSTIRFQGTSFFIDNEKILMVKGDDSEEIWSDAAAAHDVERLMASILERQEHLKKQKQTA